MTTPDLLLHMLLTAACPGHQRSDDLFRHRHWFPGVTPLEEYFLSDHMVSKVNRILQATHVTGKGGA